jgi:hypothetical protein
MDAKVMEETDDMLAAILIPIPSKYDYSIISIENKPFYPKYQFSRTRNPLFRVLV